MDLAALDVAQALDLPGQVRDLLAGQDLAGAGLAAQPGRQVQRPAPVSAFYRDGLAGVEADADG